MYSYSYSSFSSSPPPKTLSPAVFVSSPSQSLRGCQRCTILCMSDFGQIPCIIVDMCVCVRLIYMYVYAYIYVCACECVCVCVCVCV